MLGEMPTLGWLICISFFVILVSLPYFHVTFNFVAYNGLFFKTWKRNMKEIKKEWSIGRRLMLLHFWDKRICSKYRIWFVCYVSYLTTILLCFIAQIIVLNLKPSSKIVTTLFAIRMPLFGIILAIIVLWFAGLIILANSTASSICRQHSKKTGKILSTEFHPQAGRIILFLIFVLVFLMFIGFGFWEISLILRE